MRNLWKKSGILLGCALLSCSMAGCGASNKEVFVNQTDNVAELSFSWWGNDDRHNYTMDGLDAFLLKNPDIRIKSHYSVWNGYENRMKAYMRSHTESDVMQINFNWLSMFSPNGEGFYDLYKLTDIIHLDTFDKEDLKYGEINGKLNAIPISFNTYAVFQNKSLYDQYGLEVPKTWDEYFQAAEKMSADGIYQLGAVKKHTWCMLLAYYEQSTGKYVFDDDGTFLLTEADVKMMLEFYEELLEKKVLFPVSEFDRADFQNGTVASSIAWITDADNYCNVLKDAGSEVIVGDYPHLAESKTSGQYIKPSCMYAVSAKTLHPKAAGRLLRFLISDKEMVALQGLEKGVPASKNALQALTSKKFTESFQYQANQKMQKDKGNMRLMVPEMENEDIYNTFMQGADEFLYGKQPLEDCVKQICDGLQELCK